MSKLRAFGVHLLASGAVMGVLLAVFVRRWYPMPYFLADGGWKGLRLVVGVDLVLGPLLTLVVYRPTKTRRALLFDYSVIITLQAIAMASGLWVTYTQRTVLLAFADNAFYTVDAESSVLAGPGATRILGSASSRPAYAVVRLPENRDERQEIRKESLRTGRPLYLFGRLYEPVTAGALAQIADARVDVDALAATHPELRRPLEALRNRLGRLSSGVLFLRAVCRSYDLLLAYRADTGARVGFLRCPKIPLK